MQDRMEKVLSVRDMVEIERVREFMGYEPCMPCIGRFHDRPEWAFARKNGPCIGRG